MACNILQLPSEILLHIFSFYAHDEPQEKLYNTLRKVCRTFDNVISFPEFWKIYDGSIKFHQFQTMCKKELLLKTEEVTFPCVKAGEELETNLARVYSKLPNVRRIDFSKVGEWEDQILIQLAAHCPKLCEIVICNEHTSRRKRIHAHRFAQILMVKGSNIIHFDFSHSYIANVNKLLILISTTCPNLQELIAHSLNNSSSNVCFPIGEFQQGCSQLKVLRLGYPFKYNQKISNQTHGFPELELFTHFSSFDYNFNDICLQKLLFQSTKLKVLDLRGCVALTTKCLLTLPFQNIERLFISRTRILSSNQLSEILTNWRHSLVELDVSKMDLNEINDIFLDLVSWNRMPCITTLNFSGTKLEPHVLKEILLNCPKLTFLQLEGCRRIGRGHMRAHHGRIEMDKLLSILENSDKEFPVLNNLLVKHC